MRGWARLPLPLGDFFRKVKDFMAVEIPVGIRNRRIINQIIGIIARAVEFQDIHQVQTFVEEILGNPDPKAVFKPEDHLMLR